MNILGGKAMGCFWILAVKEGASSMRPFLSVISFNFEYSVGVLVQCRMIGQQAITDGRQSRNSAPIKGSGCLEGFGVMGVIYYWQVSLSPCFCKNYFLN